MMLCRKRTKFFWQMMPENEPAENAVLEAELAADAMPQNDPDAAEEAAVNTIS